MTELKWLVTVGIAMAFIAIWTLASLYIGWSLGRDGVEHRVIVPAPTVTVAPAQVDVDVAPTSLTVSPPTINVEMPTAPPPVIHIMEQAKAESVKIEPVKAEPVRPVVTTPIKSTTSAVAPAEDIDPEFGRLLPPPKK
jgi:hypothetical protein